MYVDESGDVGVENSPTSHFILSGLVVHESRWHWLIDQTLAFRRAVRTKYSLKLREEIHAGAFLTRPGELSRIAKWRRLQLLRDALDFQASLASIRVINIHVNKTNHATKTPDQIFEIAWETLVQRFHNMIGHRNFPDAQTANEKGLLVVDQTDEVRLRSLTRRMARYNPVPNAGGQGYRPILIDSLVEDSVHRDSKHSLLLQLSDVNAYFLYQKIQPSAWIRKRGVHNYFDRLDPVLLKQASRTDPQGVVRR